jgi:hypothetical protein
MKDKQGKDIRQAAMETLVQTRKKDDDDEQQG